MSDNRRYLRVIHEMTRLLEETQAQLDSQEPRQGGAAPTYTKYMTAAEYCRMRRIPAPETYAKMVEHKARRITTKMGADTGMVGGEQVFTEEVLAEAFSD